MTTLLALLCLAAVAQDREPWGPAAEDDLPVGGTTAAQVERREVPDLDGRPEVVPPTQQLLWAPRVVLAPAYAVERYLLYPPIRAFAIWAEKNRLPVRVVDTFTVIDEAFRLRIYPTTLLDFGFRPSIGLFLGLQGRDAPYSHTSFQVAYGGNGWLAFRLRESLALTADGREGSSTLAGSEVTLGGLYSERPDLVFAIRAPNGTVDRLRFARERIGGTLGVHLQTPRWIAADLEGGVERNRFGVGAEVRDDQLLDDVFDTSLLPGFDGYTLVHGALAGAVDSRRERPESGSGFRLDVSEKIGADLEHDGDMLSVTAGELSGFLDLSGRNHTLELGQYVAVARALGDTEVPFTELVTLGGSEHMRGFLDGTFRGGSGLVSTLQYRYPAWVYTDATLFAELGGAFDDAFSTVDVDAMSLSFGTGLRTSGRRETSFQAVIAAGTSPLGADFDIDSVRASIGTNRGF